MFLDIRCVLYPRCEFLFLFHGITDASACLRRPTQFCLSVELETVWSNSTWEQLQPPQNQLPPSPDLRSQTHWAPPSTLKFLPKDSPQELNLFRGAQCSTKLRQQSGHSYQCRPKSNLTLFSTVFITYSEYFLQVVENIELTLGTRENGLDETHRAARNDLLRLYECNWGWASCKSGQPSWCCVCRQEGHNRSSCLMMLPRPSWMVVVVERAVVVEMKNGYEKKLSVKITLRIF